MSDSPPKRPSRPIKTLGVHEALDRARDEVRFGLRAYLISHLRGDLPDGEIETIAAKAGQLAREAYADGLGEIYQAGINHFLEENSPEEFDRPTNPGGINALGVCASCGSVVRSK